MKKGILLLLFLIATVKINNCKAQVVAQDSLALVDFYNSINGSSQYGLDTSWLLGPVGTWTGIQVLENRVYSIDLSYFGLHGSIPSSFANLTGLASLNLASDYLTGNLNFILGFSNLQYLNLSNNQLTGRIPPGIGNLKKLRDINLYVNQLIDSIPSSIGSLPNLVNLDLSDNQFYLNIPSSLGNLLNLQTLDLSYNQLTGSIPASFSNLTNLWNFLLDDNQLTGSFPTYIENFLQLKSVYLNKNKLTGSLPDNIGNLTNLNDAQFGNNLLTGNIPPSMGNLSSVIYLSFDHNQLTGTIPSTFKNLVKIQGLGFSNNQLTGSVAVLAQLHTLQSLSISNNNFTFDGMEDIAPLHQPDASWQYAPQANIPIHQKNNVLSVNAGGTLSNNIYKWYNGNQLVVIQYGDSTFTPTLQGNYSVAVTNSTAIALTLSGTPVQVTAVAAPLCISGTTLVSEITGTNYQWQVNAGTGFANINDNDNYVGTKTDSLQLINIPSSQYGFQYRCIVNGSVSSTAFSIQFINTWTGTVDSTWENPANWNCGVLPDANTDVIINSGTIVLNSNTTVRSLTINTGASLTVNAPYSVTVTH